MAQVNKFYSGEVFKVVSIDGHSGLCTTPDDEKSVAGCRAAIDRRNERTQTPGTSENHFGLKPEAFLIVRTKWTREYYDDGAFKAYRETTETVEAYPPELYNRKPNVNDAISDAVKRSTIVIEFETKIKVACSGAAAQMKAVVKDYPGTNVCKVWIWNSNADRSNDCFLGCYKTRAGAMRAIGRCFGAGNYKFVRQYSENGVAK